MIYLVNKSETFDMQYLIGDIEGQWIPLASDAYRKYRRACGVIKDFLIAHPELEGNHPTADAHRDLMKKAGIRQISTFRLLFAHCWYVARKLAPKLPDMYNLIQGCQVCMQENLIVEVRFDGTIIAAGHWNAPDEWIDGYVMLSPDTAVYVNTGRGCILYVLGAKIHASTPEQFAHWIIYNNRLTRNLAKQIYLTRSLHGHVFPRRSNSLSPKRHPLRRGDQSTN